MSESVEKVVQSDPRGQRLWWLITGRLVITVVLWLLAGAQWSREQLGSAGRGSLMIFVVVVTLSA
jgi:hypothetical protein